MEAPTPQSAQVPEETWSGSSQIDSFFSALQDTTIACNPIQLNALKTAANILFNGDVIW